MQTDSGNNWCLLPRIKLTSTQSCSECSSDFRHLLMPLEMMILDISKVDIHFLFPFAPICLASCSDPFDPANGCFTHVVL